MPNPTILTKILTQRPPTEEENQPGKVAVQIYGVLSEVTGNVADISGWIFVVPTLTDIELRAAVIDAMVVLINPNVVGSAVFTADDIRMP